ncbi:MAG: hypothetical protein H5T59_02885 [Anaerolineae bacterium]|nr:hypothetical protein [Anaerolineae bacterium]
MATLFLALAGLSLCAMVGGLAWAMSVSRRMGPGAGPGQRTPGQPPASFGDLKGLVRAGDWARAWPVILSIGGLLGLLLFASLAAVVGLEERMWGLASLAVTCYVIARTLYNIARS